MIIGISLHYQIKGAFCLGLLFGTFVWWAHIDQDLSDIASTPKMHSSGCSIFSTSCTWTSVHDNKLMGILVFDLVFLYIMTLNGLTRSLSDLAHLTKPDGAIPGGRWLFLVCGSVTVLSGLLSGPPLLISPESAGGIKAGAKTGLSTCVCGILFGISAFFSPLFSDVPKAGTAPLLLMIGVLLFQNVKRIDWSESRLAIPAFCCLFFIPFTYSIANGLYIAYAIYILIGMFTGDFWLAVALLLKDYNYYCCGESVWKYLGSYAYGRSALAHYPSEDESDITKLNEMKAISNSTTSALLRGGDAFDLNPIVCAKEIPLEATKDPTFLHL